MRRRYDLPGFWKAQISVPVRRKLVMATSRKDAGAQDILESVDLCETKRPAPSDPDESKVPVGPTDNLGEYVRTNSDC
jgi:hypothetical protein